MLDEAKARADRAGASGDMGKYAAGAAVGGVLGLLLGTRRGRHIGGSALKLGSVAAIGALAWKAYQDYQVSQAAGQRPQARPPAGAGPAQALPPPGFEALPPPQLEEHSQLILGAMIAAARSDGHMDEREHALLRAELARMEADETTRRWVEQQLQRPVDPADVAAAARTPEMAAEAYLASLLVTDETTVMERAYLDELARQLKLAPGLQAELQQRARRVGGA
ncbi:MAG: tellurite resistance TerB family protein [Rubrivivax sp.]|nr:tellurite resistance TerB family protein [Rubrivivax sp.]